MKNLNRRFKLEFQIIDSKQHRRRFSFTTYNIEKLPRININMACIPLKLEECWNFLEINLQTLCCKIYGTKYEALQRIIIYPNCRLRRVYLQDRHYNYSETPTEMFQAFFDMYMLKKGLDFIEKACQTDVYHTGSLEKSYINHTAEDNATSALSTEISISNDTYKTTKHKSLNAINIIRIPCDFNTSETNYRSLDTFNHQTKINDDQNDFTKSNQFFNTNCLFNVSNVENKFKKKDSNVIGSERIQNAVEIHNKGKLFNNACNLNSSINRKINSQTLGLVTSTEPKKIGKNPMLKMHVGKLLLRHNKFIKRSCSTNIQSSGNTYIIPKKCISNDNSNNIQTKKINANFTDSKFKTSTIGFPLTSDKSLNDKFNYNKIDNIRDDQNNKLQHEIVKSKHIIYKDKHMKQNKKNIQNLTSNDTKTGNIEDIFEHISSIEKEAKLEETNSQNIYFTDKTIFNVMATCNLLSEKLFDKLRNKGFTIPQTKLSIHNTIYRKNSYEKEKLIKKRRWCVNKCTSLY